MPLPPNIKTLVTAKIELYEGRKNHLYRDSLGKITVGVGQLLPNRASVLSLPLYRKNNSPQPATPQEKQDEYDAVAKLPTGHNASWYGGFTKLFLPDAEINRLRDKHITDFYTELGNIYKKSRGYPDDFDKLPSTVQLALFDLIFNLGADKIVHVFKNLDSAVKSGDWKKAAAESNRPQVGADRNLYVKQLFLTSLTGTTGNGGGKVTGKTPGVKQPLLDYLNAVAQHYGKEIYVTSGLRSAQDQAEKMWAGWGQHLEHGKIYIYLASNNATRLQLDGYYQTALSPASIPAAKQVSKQKFTEKVVSLAGHLSKHLTGDAVDVAVHTDPKILAALGAGLHHLIEKYQGQVKCHHFDTSKQGTAHLASSSVRSAWPSV